ncbi:rod shape-determining protein [Streptomyces xanthochromogenes]|uniref:Cell shape-determining protein MreB n=1 Tax=Streptomyces xanthochromogenes TaxID=67384 RepID=A0ABQ2ZQX2_9ACTN|nr:MULTISPECIES: rod shape-determining protein [Streptomyces]MYV89135.1 MreB/Mrl family cell shape determining protein [Streptomyces sp. SID1034]GGY22808.1 rod shape-determining protein [Streptomyces xanthochromogenes]GHB69873.1 rod shape-determining protein [Streptomyces xanthochromogenes]
MDIGIDLGTANTLLYARGQGIVLNEPSVVAMKEGGRTALAVGTEAKETIGRTPGSITAIRPLRDGVISDYEAAEEMIRHFVKKAVPGRRPRTRMVVCVPSGVTPVERRAIVHAAQRSGAKAVHLIEEPMAAAIGAGLPVAEPRGSMVVDIGGGTTEVAVISLGGIVTAQSLRVGGDRLDTAITDYVRKEHSLLIGERTAEDVKCAIGSAWPVPGDEELEERAFTIRGREKVGGLPKTLSLTAREVRAALDEPVESIIAAVKVTLEECPPELSGDVMEHGIVLTGGGALLPGLDLRMASATGIPVFVADNPLDCVALGSGKCVEDFDQLQKLLVGT